MSLFWNDFMNNFWEIPPLHWRHNQSARWISMPSVNQLSRIELINNTPVVFSWKHFKMSQNLEALRQQIMVNNFIMAAECNEEQARKLLQASQWQFQVNNERKYVEIWRWIPARHFRSTWRELRHVLSERTSCYILTRLHLLLFIFRRHWAYFSKKQRYLLVEIVTVAIRTVIIRWDITLILM